VSLNLKVRFYVCSSSGEAFASFDTYEEAVGWICEGGSEAGYEYEIKQTYRMEKDGKN